MLLWRNEGNGKFRDVAAEAGIAFDGQGRVVAGMGLDAADLNRDGAFELLQSNFQSRPNVLFQMEGGPWFTDRSQAWGLVSSKLLNRLTLILRTSIGPR